MTRDEIMKLAKEAGLILTAERETPGWSAPLPGATYPDRLERFAALVRAAALEEAAGVTGEFAQKWWSMHCASNKHMDTTRKAHDDFCALQAAIRTLKTGEKP